MHQTSSVSVKIPNTANYARTLLYMGATHSSFPVKLTITYAYLRICLRISFHTVHDATSINNFSVRETTEDDK